MDVVKIRLQAQQKPFHTGDAFIRNVGIMDYCCVCSHCEANGISDLTSAPDNYFLERVPVLPLISNWQYRAIFSLFGSTTIPKYILEC